MVGRAVFDYSGESAIVTGATKGIGRGIADALAAAGANVAINARTAADVRETVATLDAEYDGTFVGAPGDVSDPAAIERVVETAVTPNAGEGRHTPKYSTAIRTVWVRLRTISRVRP